MWKCPLCGEENNALVCVCGFDRSRDYESYPTFGQLPAGVPSLAGRMKKEPRKAVVTCPHCGRSTELHEDEILHQCRYCRTMLDPKFYVLPLRSAFASCLRSKDPADHERLYFIASALAALFEYMEPDTCRSLAKQFSTLAHDPESLGIQLPAYHKAGFEGHAMEANIRLSSGVGKSIFDNQIDAPGVTVSLMASIGLIGEDACKSDHANFTVLPFHENSYQHYTQSPLFQDALSAQNGMDYDQAMELFREAEGEGNPYAAAHLGMLYHYGRGCVQAREAALDCFERGARAGDPLAATWITEYYRMGHVLEQDKAFSAKLYAAVDPELNKMCDAGDSYAQYFRAFYLVHGINIEKNLPEGIRLLELAYAQGHRGAAVELASCCYYGDGVERSYETSFRLLTEQPSPDNRGAQYLLGLCYYWGNGTEQNYDLAFRHFKRAAELDHGTAKDYLGDCYRLGRGTAVDYAQAAKWYHDAADNHGNIHSALELGFMYRDGQGVTQDDRTAIYYWRIAAEDGNAAAQNQLGFAYMHGNGVETNRETGLYWHKKAADANYAPAQFWLGYEYLIDENSANHQEGLAMLTKSAEAGYDWAQYKLGHLYELGFRVPLDSQKAFEWYQKAAAQDLVYAQCALGRLYLDPVDLISCWNGQGVDRDPDKGIEYLVKALDAGHKPAALELADRYYLGIEDYKGQSRYTNPTLAHKYAMLAVEDETNGDAQYRMATIIHHAFGNPNGAKDWYHRAVNNGNNAAKLELGKLYIQQGENLSDAYRLLCDEALADGLTKSAYAESLYWRSVCLENGYGCVKNKRMAKELYNKATQLGYVDTAKKEKRFGLF